MWDAVRKIFSHDAAPEDEPPSRNRTMSAPAEAPSRADSETSAYGQDMAANAADVSGPRAPEEVMSPAGAHAPAGADAVEVSPPGHAPQGLAAEPDAHTSSGDRRQATGDSDLGAATVEAEAPEGSGDRRPAPCPEGTRAADAARSGATGGSDVGVPTSVA
jgi:hypothetical protein